MSAKTLENRYSAFVNGEWIKGSKEIVSLNPADRRDQVAIFTEADKNQVRAACDSARNAYKKWANTPAPVRAGMIQNFGKLVEHSHLLGQGLGSVKSLRKQHDLANLFKVRNNHRDRSEQRLQIVRELGSAGVARIHRDEDAHVRIQQNILALEKESWQLLHAGILDDLNLSRYH